LKAATAIALASRLSHVFNHPVVPLFWVAAEDHDVLEVNRVFLNGQRFVHAFKGELKRGKVPQVGEISIREAREPLLEFLQKALPETEFTPWVMDMVASADYSNYATAFFSLMEALFADWPLCLIDPMALRPLTAPILAALVERWHEVRSAFDDGTAAVKDQGFTPPLDTLGLFEIQGGFRVPLEIKEDGIRLDSGWRSFQEAADRIRARPQDFSPGAGLRPVLQDGILPITAFIGGPSELLYLWQIQRVYQKVHVTPSPVFPRISSTFVENKILRAAEKAGLAPGQILHAGTYLNQNVPEEEADLRTPNIEEKAQALLKEVDAILEDHSPRWLKRSRETLAAHIQKIVKRLREEQAQGVVLNQQRIEKIMKALFPSKKPQERVVNVLQFLNLYGPEFVRLTLENLDPLQKKHQLVFVKSLSEEEERCIMGVDVLAIGAHPDDVDMIAGGTIAKLSQRGKTVVILDLTRGEMGTRGSPETRAQEATKAGQVLGVDHRITLDLGDGRLEDHYESRRQVIEVIRELRPQLVLGHYWEDLHPDHVAAGWILRSIMYPCGFANYPAEGEPYRPREFLFFMAHFTFTPSFIVDITGYHEQKIEAVKCFASQLYAEGKKEPATGISQPDFLQKLEARARHFGSQIDRTFGEPFYVLRAVPMGDPVDHYAPFPRIHAGREGV
jgi:bacillithiol biosynthesis cysteine-adding enzyme BshC/bacillithiol biosynthesis deacetylase BshB1